MKFLKSLTKGPLSSATSFIIFHFRPSAHIGRRARALQLVKPRQPARWQVDRRPAQKKVEYIQVDRFAEGSYLHCFIVTCWTFSECQHTRFSQIDYNIYIYSISIFFVLKEPLAFWYTTRGLLTQWVKGFEIILYRKPKRIFIMLKLRTIGDGEGHCQNSLISNNYQKGYVTTASLSIYTPYMVSFVFLGQKKRLPYIFHGLREKKIFLCLIRSESVA